MTSSGFQAMPTWQWPGQFPDETHADPPPAEAHAASSEPGNTDTADESEGNTRPKHRKHWGPRTCRICLENVQPTFNTPSDEIPGMFQPPPSVTYEDEQGRLLRPCKCKGSQKYVHENCLQAWRHADPSYGRRNFWQCPTCGYRYRLARVQWGSFVSSVAAQIILTATVLLLVTFVLGFIADPIINIYTDPYGPLLRGSPSEYLETFEEDEASTWVEHFAKGLASVGVLGFIKVIIAQPFRLFNFRTGVGGANRPGTTGRNRVADVGWLVILIGVMTFLWAVYKMVRAWSRRFLEKAGERVMDVHGDNADEDDEDEEGSAPDSGG